MIQGKDKPLISIVIPAYNASNYLAEAIDCALAQTYPYVEIIVVNDGSRDDGATERVALSYGNKIRYFFKENGGSSSALNMGIANMTGEWFSWLSHDDLYAPEKLEKQMAYMATLNLEEDELSKHIVFSASELIDAYGKTIRASRPKQEQKLSAKVESFPHNGFLIAEPTKFNFHGCSCLVHKDVFAQIGGFNENLRLLNDVDFWFRIYAAGYNIHYVPEALVKGRVHAGQVSKSIGYSYHNSEQDMFWGRSLDWLLNNGADERLLLRFGRNAYLKTRNDEGDRAFESINVLTVVKSVLKSVYKCRASVRSFAKSVYLKYRVYR